MIHIIHQTINGRAPDGRMGHLAVARCGLQLRSPTPLQPGRSVLVGHGPGVQHKTCPRCAGGTKANPSYVDPNAFQDERGVPLPPLQDDSMTTIHEVGHFEVKKTEQGLGRVVKHEDDSGWGPPQEGQYDPGQTSGPGGI